VVELGRQTRSSAGLKHRQPLRRAVVYGGSAALEGHLDEVAGELRVKRVDLGSGGGERARLKPNLRVLGPRLGSKLPPVRKALEEGRWERRGEEVLVEGESLRPDEVLSEREAVNEGYVVASDGDLSVELDPDLDDALRLEGRVLDLIHRLNSMRREAGLALTDRIVVTLPESERDLLGHEEWIKGEVLAVEIRLDGIAEPQIAKA
jgi:isoleucyl-tRNA synthetase